ncbi:MAG TPA: hypothetical protein VHU92_18725 [Streptosporangiaceae bacterium]|nr:hypothetical protein [Streptosporangiaceae bacterium]
MRSNWRFRLAGVTAAIAIAVSVGPAAQLLAGSAGHAVAMAPRDCPQGTHWDTILHECV